MVAIEREVDSRGSRGVRKSSLEDGLVVALEVVNT